MKTQSIWSRNEIVRFFSENRQRKLKNTIEGLKTSIEHKQAPMENGYNYLFEDIFPKPENVSEIWEYMDVEEKMNFLTSAAVICDLYKHAWNKEPRFLPDFIKKIIHTIV